MLQISFDTSKTLASLTRLETAFLPAMQRAVLNTARLLVGRVVERTLAPPVPPAKVYERTGRLVSGWKPAGDFLGVSVPSATGRAAGSNEGSYRWQPGPGEIVFTAVNLVPYAAYVEFTGTWIKPPPGQVRRAPYRMVQDSLIETEQKGDLPREVAEAWKSLGV